MSYVCSHERRCTKNRIGLHLRQPKRNKNKKKFPIQSVPGQHGSVDHRTSSEKSSCFVCSYRAATPHTIILHGTMGATWWRYGYLRASGANTSHTLVLCRTGQVMYNYNIKYIKNIYMQVLYIEELIGNIFILLFFFK